MNRAMGFGIVTAGAAAGAAVGVVAPSPALAHHECRNESTGYVCVAPFESSPHGLMEVLDRSCSDDVLIFGQYKVSGSTQLHSIWPGSCDQYNAHETPGDVTAFRKCARNQNHAAWCEENWTPA